MGKQQAVFMYNLGNIDSSERGMEEQVPTEQAAVHSRAKDKARRAPAVWLEVSSQPRQKGDKCFKGEKHVQLQGNCPPLCRF